MKCECYIGLRTLYLDTFNFFLKNCKYISLAAVFIIAFGSADYLALGFLIICMWFMLYPMASDQYWVLLVSYAGLVLWCT